MAREVTGPAVPVRPWEPKQLATPADVARWLPPRRRVVLPAVVRLGRRTGRRPL